MENVTDSNLIAKNMELDDNGVNQLMEARKWSMLLSIAGFVFIGLMIVVFIVLLVLIVTRGSSGYSGITMPLIPLLFILVIYFFPVYYLYQFSSQSKRAIHNADSGLLATAFKYLKMHYRYMGILFIIVMGIYLVVILLALLSGSHIFNYF